MSERTKGAAAALMFRMLDAATQAQRDGGPGIDVVVTLDGPAASALGFAGEGELTLSLRPAHTPKGWPGHCMTDAEDLKSDEAS